MIELAEGLVGSPAMGGGREPLCPRCGAATYERGSERESRCSECGLGRTSVPLRMEHRSPSEPSTALGDDKPDALAEVRQRTRAVFADASFLPCGLDTRWVGTRWFGGSGTSNGDVT